MYKIKRRLSIIAIGCISLLLLFTPRSLAHWADLAVADVTLDRDSAQVTLTVPTGLIAFADDDRNGQLSPTEIQQHQAELQTYLGQKIELKDSGNQLGRLSVAPVDFATASLPPSSSSHSNLQLTYNWPQPIAGMTMQYRLFEPGVPTARCLATVKSKLASTTTLPSSATPDSPPQSSGIKNVIFSPESQTATLLNQAAIDWSKGLWVTIIGAFVWGAAHATSPGHGKTLVGTYLIGERATAQHAIVLGLTTTITHTLGVFSLGAMTLLLAQTVLPEQVLPWLSLGSGLWVILIGGSLLRQRLGRHQHHTHHSHHHPHHSHDHPHEHHHEHEPHHAHHHDNHHHQHDHNPDHTHTHSEHTHTHGGHTHTHLPPDDAPLSWRSLLALGISGGIVPCPSALVLLLSAIAIGQVTYGLLLVFAFSLGLAAVLVGLGLLLIYAKQFFVRIAPGRLRQVKWIVKFTPAVTALTITLVGIGISLQAIGQIKGIPV